MKKIVWIIGIIVIAVIIYFVTRKVSALNKIEVDASNVNLGVKNIQGAIVFASAGSQGSLGINVSNFSNEKLKFANCYIELYSMDGILIAYQTTPISEPIVINPNANTLITIPFYFKNAFATKLVSQLGTDIVSMLTNYFETGKIGTQIVVKGYLSVGTMKIPIKFNKKI